MEVMGYKVDATILWIIQLTLTTALKSTVRLSPTIAEVLENGNVTLTCAYNGTQHQTFSSWRTAADSQQNTFISMSDENCKATGYLNNAELYDWGCLGNSTFALTLKKVGLSQHQSKWTCSQNNIHSNEITIFVKVPIESVTMNKENNDTITSIENATLQFKCSTSYCRPAPTVIWVLDSGTLDRKDDKVIVSGNTTQQTNTNDDNLISLTSTISFHVNRSVNGWSIYCSGRNIQNRNTAISTATKLNIIYPPDGPPAIEGFSNGSGYTVIHGQLGKLSCSITGGNPLAELAWHCYNVSLPPVTTDTTVRSIVTWRASRDQNNTCECTSNHTSTTIISTEVNVIVQYPPSLPVFTMASVPVHKIVNIIVNNTLSIKCTSNSKPIPTYKWNAPVSSISSGQSLYIGNISKADNGTYNCTAENRMFPSNRDNVTGSSTTSIEVNVLFSPTIPIFRYGSSNGIVIESNSLDVVENDTLTVACSSIANPEPEISWSGETTSRDVLKFASISADFNKTCYATNTMNETVGESRIGSTEAAISVRVLFPPRKPTIRYFTTRGHQVDCLSNNFSVIEKTSFSMSCVAISRPEPTYSWYGPITSTIADLKIIGINRVQKGEYSCNAFNTMKRTFGSSQSGEHARNIYLNILYPPTIGHLTNQTVIEGSPFNILCPVNPGNPEQSTITWTRNGDTKQWNTQTLLLSNTHRKDHMIYTCTVYNTMKPSCENESKGKASRSFHLNVVYKTYVKEFHVKGFVGLSEVTVNENDSLEFKCSTESNPKSSIKIGFNEKILILKSGVNTLTYSVTKATCLHEGVYKCFGNNTYNNEEPSVKHVTLRVNCFPRPSPTVRIRDKIYTTTHVTATLSFTALAYPVPYQSSFIWQRKIGLMWSTLANSTQIKIIRSGLLTNLTIVNVTKSDFGKYRLSIENAVGIFEQIFYIAAKVQESYRR
ncbi:hemicentin-1-like isoform X2 [Mercenaria mercenaria]|uniref:hemicentin-1-like isoform X2 n=1 Tax=Mercenaria mercenaria TaxID=6596 RepID=UPI00234EB8C6|nr:hemicentin-1-like isoform X2 [Mercenaria mercenaria]